MLTTLQDGMKAFPGNMKLETMYAAYYMKEGQTFQKQVMKRRLLKIILKW